MSCRGRLDGLRLRPQFGSKYDDVLNRFFPGFSSNLEAQFVDFRKTILTGRGTWLYLLKASLVIRMVDGFRDFESRDFDETHGARIPQFPFITILTRPISGKCRKAK